MEKVGKNKFQIAAIENARWLDKVLAAGTSLAGLIVLLKLTGATEFEWNSAKLSTDSAWVVFVLFSVAHLYTAWLFIRSLNVLWAEDTLETSKQVFDEVTSTGGIFVRGLLPRTYYAKNRLGMYIYEMKSDDPSTWVTYGAAAVLIGAITPFDISNLNTFLILLTASFFIAYFNWMVGANWIVALSELTIDHNKSRYHSQILEETQRNATAWGYLLILPGIFTVDTGSASVDLTGCCGIPFIVLITSSCGIFIYRNWSQLFDFFSRDPVFTSLILVAIILLYILGARITR
jgi:hypothetical protein